MDDGDEAGMGEKRSREWWKGVTRLYWYTLYGQKRDIVRGLLGLWSWRDRSMHYRFVQRKG